MSKRDLFRVGVGAFPTTRVHNIRTPLCGFGSQTALCYFIPHPRRCFSPGAKLLLRVYTKHIFYLLPIPAVAFLAAPSSSCAYTHTHTHTHTQTNPHPDPDPDLRPHPHTHTHTHTHIHPHEAPPAGRWKIANVCCLERVCVCRHIHRHTCMCTHTQTHVHVYTYRHTCMCTHTHTQTHVHVYTYTYTDTRACVHMHVYVYAQGNIYLGTLLCPYYYSHTDNIDLHIRSNRSLLTL